MGNKFKPGDQVTLREADEPFTDLIGKVGSVVAIDPDAAVQVAEGDVAVVYADTSGWYCLPESLLDAVSRFRWPCCGLPRFVYEVPSEHRAVCPERCGTDI